MACLIGDANLFVFLVDLTLILPFFKVTSVLFVSVVNKKVQIHSLSSWMQFPLTIPQEISLYLQN